MKSLFIVSEANIDPDVYKVSVLIFLIIVVLSIIVSIWKSILDHKLKNKMLDKEISEELVTSILQKDSNSAMHTSLKWFFLLLAMGIGLFITNKFLPLGLHSIGIMAISIAAGFLCNTLYLNRFIK